MDKKVDLIAGRLNNRNGETLYWKLEKMVPCKLGDFAIVENANGYVDLLLQQKQRQVIFQKQNTKI